MLCHRGHWDWLGYGYWAMEERATGRFYGAVGFTELHRDLTPSIASVPETDWVLTPQLHGRGIGTEAVAAIMALGDAHFGNTRAICIIDPENIASLALAARFGYQKTARPEYQGKPIVLLERVK